MISNTRAFGPDDTVVEMIEENYNVIPLLSRFSIPLGVGDKTSLSGICTELGIDVDALLLVINYQMSRIVDIAAVGTVSPLHIVDFLHNSHEYFINYKFPHIRRNLKEALEKSHADLNPAIVRFFDDFVKAVTVHFRYEEENVFPYVRKLTDGEQSAYNIDIFRSCHDEVTNALTELKNLILKYYRTSVPNRMYDVLVDIYNCEEDLESHNDIENNLLIPMVKLMESRTANDKR